MSTPFDLYGVVAPAGSKVVMALYLPAGKVIGAASTVTGGTVTGTTALTPGATVVYVGMAEATVTLFEATSNIAGTDLPDTTDRPYMVEARIVDPATVMTTYAGISAGFTGAPAYWAAQPGHTAADAIAYSRDVPATLVNGVLTGGVWGASGGGSVVGGLSPDQDDKLTEIHVGIQSLGQLV